MTFDLHPYQAEVVDKLAKSIRRAQDDFEMDGALSAIGLVAPTASGKTVMAAALIERLLDGDDLAIGNVDLTILWLSDQPSLNVQSKNKIELARPNLTYKRLRNLGEADQRVLDPGVVYFMNSQQFSRGSTSYHARIVDSDGTVRINDDRTYGVWDMVANTVKARGKNVLLIIDEAHRGVGTEVRSMVEGKTTQATLIHGGATNVGGPQPPMPVVLGISATLDRFNESIQKTGGEAARTMVPVLADVVKVRESGLLKDHIDIPAPVEDQEADQTLVADGVERFKEITQMWADYHADTGAPLVEPVLVVQVRPAISKPDLRLILGSLEEAWSVLKDEAVCHSFDSHQPLQVGSGPNERTIRYVSPDAIDDDDRVKVVLFKTALNTGWDCPRAEVMVSLRGSADPINIAQLIGRMVRTPLAKRIDDGEDSLNSVFLSLPYYDDDEVAKVVAALTEDDVDTRTVRVHTVSALPNQNVPSALFDLLGQVPSAHRTAPTFKTVTRRARALATELAKIPLSVASHEELTTRLTHTMVTEFEVNREVVSKRAQDAAHLTTKEHLFTGKGAGYEKVSEGDIRSRVVKEADMERAYRKALRDLPDGVGASYFDHLVVEEGLDGFDAQARVVAMSRIPSVVVGIEKTSSEQIDMWKNSHQKAVGNLSADRRNRIREMWAPSEHPLIADMIEVPLKVAVATKRVVKGANGEPTIELVPTLPKHLFSLEGTDEYPAKLGSSWERVLIDKELAEPTLLGWYRNPSSGKHALSVEYTQAGIASLLHPDFLFFHDDDGHVVVDIVDPHLHSNADTGPKWRGLAAYAEQVGTGTGSSWLRHVRAVIEALSPTGDKALRSIDLRAGEVREALNGANDKADMERVFAEFGFDY